MQSLPPVRIEHVFKKQEARSKKQEARSKSRRLSSSETSYQALEPRKLLAGLDGSEVIGLPDDQVASAYIFTGDHSRSNSEKWDTTVGGLTHSASGFGVVQRDKRDFQKGESYPVSVQHVDSIYETGEEDYDYRAWIDQYANPRWTSGSSTPSGSEFFVTDPQQLLQRRYFNSSPSAGVSSSDPTIGKSATLHFPAIDLDIDSNADGNFERSTAEDVAEADQTTGLFFPVHSGDKDADGTPDNFDFDGIEGLSFTSIAISLSSNLAHANAASISLTFDYDDAGLSAGDSGLFRVWTKDASSVRTADDLISSGEAIDASSIGLAPGSTVTLYLEAVNSTRRTTNFDPISVAANVAGSTVWNGMLFDEIHASAIDFDLEAKTVLQNNSAGDALGEDVEDTEGAFLPVNNDDDDYDEQNEADFKQKLGAIDGENDLLPIVIKKVKGGGTFNLEIPDHLRVWTKGENSTEQVKATTEISAIADTTLYVEGIAKGTGNIKISWERGANKIANVDEVKITTFEWNGPLNVPGYSLYNYTANGALETSKWVTPSEGKIQTGHDTSEVSILWGEGAVVGRAIYAVNDKYRWGLDVNVVQVEISADNNSATYEGKVTQAGEALAWSSSPRPLSPAMKAIFTVSSVIGPEVNGKVRGVKFMEMGLIQLMKVTRQRAFFDTATPKLQRTSSMENYEGGGWIWDLGKEPDPGTTEVESIESPWITSDEKHYLRPAEDSNLEDIRFEQGDIPSSIASDKLFAGEDLVSRTEAEFEFKILFAVRSTDARVITDDIDRLNVRLELDWNVSAYGTVNPDNFKWMPDDRFDDGTVNEKKSVDGDKKWEELKNGSNIPVPTVGTNSNSLRNDPETGRAPWAQSLQHPQEE